MTRPCAACRVPISAKRLAALPDTPWCVQCAETRVVRVGGVMRASEGEAPDIEVVASVAFARLVSRVESRAAMVVLDRPIEGQS